MPPVSYNAGVFVSELDVPDGFMTGTAAIQSGLALNPDKMAAFDARPYVPFASRDIPVEFAQGFSGLESGGGHYWEWSDGPSGGGVIDLWNRSGHAVSVAFNACVKTGYAQPSKLLRCPGRVRKL